MADKPGCDLCIPVAFELMVIHNTAYCVHCGRQLPEEEWDLVRRVSAPPRRPNNSFEKGIRTDERGLPYLDANGQPLRMGEPFNPRDYGEGPIVLKETP